MTNRFHIDIHEGRDGLDWDSKLAGLRGAHPLQSWAWGAAKEAAGERVLRLMALRGGQPLAMAQVFERSVPWLGFRVAWIPKGPAWHGDEPHAAPAAALLRSELRSRGFRFVLAQPYFGGAAPGIGARLPVQPQQTYVLDLTPDLQALERSARKGWRTNRNQFFRRGGEVIDDAGEGAIEDLIRLQSEAERRKGFQSGVTPSGLRALWKAFRGRQAPGVCGHVFRALAGGACIGAALYVRTGERAHSLFAAFDYDARRWEPNEALDWTALRQFRSAGVKLLDLEGGAPKGSRRSSGVSEYKRRMGARLADLPPMHCGVLI